MDKIAENIAYRVLEEEGELRSQRPHRSDFANWGTGTEDEHKVEDTPFSKYYEKNKDKEVERSTEWKKDHPKKWDTYQKEYHKDVYQPWHKQDREKNRKKYNKYQKALMRRLRKENPNY